MITAQGYIHTVDFWNSVFAAATALIVTTITIYAGFWITNPRHKIMWNADLNVDLLSNEDVAVEVSSNGVTVANPRVVRLSIRNVGRKAILPEHFSSGNDSLVFDFGEPVVSVTPKVDPDTAPTPDLDIAGNALHVKKSLIQPKQIIHILAVVDGEEKKVTCRNAHIVGTPIKRSKWEISRKPLIWRDPVNLAMGIFLIVSAIAFIYLFTADYFNTKHRCEIKGVDGKHAVLNVTNNTCDGLHGKPE